MRKTLTALAAVVALSAATPAFAFHCPNDMKKIDAALQTDKAKMLSSDQLAEVKQWRAEGEAYHKAGQHQKSVDTLAKAMKMLGIE